MTALLHPSTLAKWNRAVPRYTSYPTAPQFYAVEESFYRKKLEAFDLSDKPLSLYIHIPFCKTMCLFCACSVILNRKSEKQSRYVDLLLKEIDLLPFQKKRRVTQLHLGGGTPTSLNEEEFSLLFEKLKERFIFGEEDEISIEIDPRTVFADGGNKLTFLKELGFNRVSFGVQDLNADVQEAVRRRQSEEMTVATFEKARELKFLGINIDLIYGLPLQTVESFRKTADTIVKMQPDRISFFSYAKVPWLKAHQKAIDEALLPKTEEKFQIYVEAREKFLLGGYTAIGMDHFSLEKDPLSRAYRQKKLMRNFQGYSLNLAEDMIGLGVSSIGFLENCYFQNVKTIEEYEEKIGGKKLSAFKGYELNCDDQIRRFVIQRLMCHFSLDKGEFFQIFGLVFDDYFKDRKGAIENLEKEKLLLNTKQELLPTPMGRLFIRLIAAVFDAYLKEGSYSKAV